MEINIIAFGNEQEAFIEKRLGTGVNIIFSDDNNKGKTILIQGMMFALGNEPIFPSGFNYSNYFFYTMITVDQEKYEFLRKNNTVIVRYGDSYQICNSLSELKYYVDKHIFPLPRIYKKTEKKIVDLYLYYQLFFVGQDKRNTSNTINNGYYNKNDFINMLCTLNGYPIHGVDKIDDEHIIEEIKGLKVDIKDLKKLMKFTKKNPQIAQFTSESSDRDKLNIQKKNIGEIRDNISKYKKSRTREINRKIKLECLIDELNSLNRDIKQGKVICSKCGSTSIIYKNNDIKFEVSNKVVRRQILNSIREQISIKNDIIDEYSTYISIEQKRLTKELQEIPIEIRKILMYSEDILSNEEYNEKLVELEDKLKELTLNQKHSIEQDKVILENKNKMIDTLLKKMNTFYSEVDPSGNLFFNDIFTKKDETFSGSEEQEYYYSRLMAINDYFLHRFPIIVDSFRRGEVSSNKENIMINGYKSLNKQVILTATLKEEEYDKNKYNSIVGITAIDYSNNLASKILQPKSADEFLTILETFNISI